MTQKIHNQTTFCQTIEKLVREKRITYFEAVCEYMNDNNLDPEIVPKLINRYIKLKIQAEATDLNLINRGKKPAKLCI